ncbi:MFS transporter [Ponticoccus sp. SC2-23]|uniref:MFS transporter n=1 Tax=Alexandriicola marinus TaxID=2081710 RepID=UPI000FDA8C73|nr:MFS transporter [Alexandriicola marinus]MBM1221859.1 MFS transporter [Ponticoccus sp. SC6-9]MBM1226210.1 MFS transporter [Ponticoccus sp. SC6-15]MBM1230806.1 MFS transporter [Ponticoccus sp. SC6-38]MBM1235353.1 MFS transporter [Ponticoccus sp. SC6-45]MBM1239828.1 MFS transporter [Ponticoccus sp. SC6-49]MBM1243972.1 MFS transporter [Ponticoccus sp. SC2-64]MBM1248877.1 MFS transporter [Ponticoccus sp. SC6-42]MBM1253483.1 MFS transporter [Ponticoccus sp. SC6-33]MBM1257836.1 MFS transporter
MKLGIAGLVLAYTLSQFYRAFLAVLTPALSADIGATPADLAFASGLWFLVFAAMQIPVGAALDHFGPRRTAAILLAVGGAGGAAVFASAQSPVHIALAMALIGAGSSPVLMSSYFIFARVYPPAVFATLAGAMIGVGSLGNIAGSAPLAWSVAEFGWRETMWALSAVTAAAAALLFLVVRDPESIARTEKGSVLDLLRMPVLWPIFAMMFVSYAPSAGIRGLWVGPYAEGVFAADTVTIGRVSLVMGLAMIAGNFLYGPLDRILGTRKWIVIVGNLIGAAACLALFALPDASLLVSTVLLALVGLMGASFPVILAHGRAFFPPHLTGRGVTLVNLFGIGGVGVSQFVTGRIHGTVAGQSDVASAPFAAIFLFFGVSLLIGIAIYFASRDRTD